MSVSGSAQVTIGAATGSLEPVGMTPIVNFDYHLDPQVIGSTSTGTYVSCGPAPLLGVVAVSNLNGNTTKISDATDPVSPPTVWQDKYPIGTLVGNNPCANVNAWQAGTVHAGDHQHRVVYMRRNINWYGAGDGLFELMHGGCGGVLKCDYFLGALNNNSTNFWGLKALDGGGNPALTSQSHITFVAHNYHPDGVEAPIDYCSQESPVTFNAWHKVEFLLTMNDIGVANGSMRARVDGADIHWLNQGGTTNLGTLITGLMFRNAANPWGWYNIHNAGVYGGGAQFQTPPGKARIDYIRHGHLYVSVKD